MRAAAAFGIPAAQTDVLMVNDTLSVLVSTRYDRREREGSWSRIHQEDFCQALSVLPEHKYQDRGGPGIAHMADLIAQIRNRKDREESRTRFFDGLLFNIAAWATDAHAKNYSILLAGDRQTLAPLYDIASHAPYPSVPNSPPEASAMKIGGEYALARIGKAHLLKAAARIRVDTDWASARIDEVRQNVSHTYAEAAMTLAGVPSLRRAAQHVVDSVHQKSKDRGWVDNTSTIDLALTTQHSRQDDSAARDSQSNSGNSTTANLG
ncbi:hypothetical protein GCM10011313_21710 [Mycetocola zhadangensis]|nr:hypothetical protein GCM10011313_21710 [Mycetocola zhadangensis]